MNSAKSAITLEKSNIKVFGTGRAIYVKGSGNTLTMDKDSAITTDKGLYAIYWESTAHLTIENSVVNVNDAISVFAFTSGETGTTLNIINSEIYMHAKDYVGTTHGIIKDTAAGNDTINIVNSKLDASDTNARRVMYLHSGSTGSVVNVTDSILIGSSSSGACPPIKAVTSTLHLTGVNQISGGWSYITTGGACEATDKSIYGNWMIEDHAKTTQVEAQLGTNGTTVGVDVEKVVDGNNSIRATSRVEAVKINEWRMMIKNSNGTFDEADVTYGTVFFRVADYEAWLANNAGKSVADFIAAADGTTYTVVKVAADSNGLYLANDGDLLINAELTGVDALASTEIGVVSYIACDGTPVFYSSYNGDNTDTIAVGTAA
ncbi:MAG: hypothetical protein IJX62_05300 [Clostridia bacterium]|nr:hypothetical protein [Clostridia bacterium]